MVAFLQFWITFFATYDITTEVIILIMISILLTISAFSKPEKTYMMKLCSIGIHLAIFTIIVHIAMLAETIHMRQHSGMLVFQLLYILFGQLFITELNFIFLYINQLSYKRRSQRKQMAVMCVIFSIICNVIMMIPLAKGQLLTYENGVYALTMEANAYVFCSFICACMCMAASISNRHDVSRVVYWGICIFVPIDAIGVLAQFYFPTAYFICATFAIPFFIFYILFHAFKYDEVMGCQNFDAGYSLLNRYLASKQDFITVRVTFPKLESRDMTEIRDIMVYVGNNICRKIEAINKNIRIYSLSITEYQMICPIKSEEEYEDVRERLLKVLDTPVKRHGILYHSPMNVMIGKRFEQILDVGEYNSLMNMKSKEFSNQERNEVLYLAEEDAKKYKKQELIENNLLDIRNNSNLDDERVLVFIQPIYSIKNQCFKTGESLMRMQIDGKMIFPDEFIPVAEDIGCIHALTRIMLYKASKKAIELSKFANFDALTVNVSTIEMTDPKVHEEFLQIIRQAGANPKNIRIEITESTSILNYDTIISNMVKMKEAGMHFYLDDFGTGYSNIDRMISMPFKTIKFDKSLLYKALEDKKSEKLFVLLVSFFKSNGFFTVIEGVEDEAQRDYVIGVGFDYIQGYFYSKPVPAVDADRFYEDSRKENE